MIRVLVADDHFAIRAGIKAIFDREEDIRVLWEAANGTEAVAQVRRTPVDLLLLDMRMPGLDGLEVIRVLVGDGHRPRILAFSAFADTDLVCGAMKAGADGYFLKDGGREELLTAIRSVMRGECYLCPAAKAAMGPEIYSAMSRQRLIRMPKNPFDIKADVIAAEMARPTAAWPKDVRRFHEYLVDHAFDESCTVSHLLQAFKIKDTRFPATYRRWVGRSPREHLTELRLVAGHRLLTFGGKPTEVALAVGFLSEAAFAMAYGKWYGQKPSKSSRQSDQRKQVRLASGDRVGPWDALAES